jgi:hypothetical protein
MARNIFEEGESLSVDEVKPMGSDLRRVFPLLSGSHSNAVADRAITEAQFCGEYPEDTDQADLGLDKIVVRRDSVRTRYRI